MKMNTSKPSFFIAFSSALFAIFSISSCDRTNKNNKDDVGEADNSLNSNNRLGTSEARSARTNQSSSDKSERIDLFRNLSIDELREMLAEVKNSSDSETIDRLLIIDILSEIARKDSEVAIEELLKLDRKLAISWISRSVFEVIASRDPAKLESWISGAEKEIVDDFGVRAVEVLAVLTPKSAIDICLNLPNRKDLSSNLFFIIGSRSLEEASSFVAMLPKNMRDEALISAANGAGMNSPQRGLEFLTQLEVAKSGLYIISMQNLVYATSRGNPSIAVDLIKNFDSNILQQILSSHKVVSLLGEQAPNELIDLMSSIVLTKSNEKIFSAAVGSMAGGAPVEAISWISDFPDSSAKDNLLRLAYNRWGDSNPVDFSNVAIELSGELRGAALASLANSWGRSDVNSALKWATNLPSIEANLFVKNVLTYEAGRNPENIAAILKSGQSTDIDVYRAVASGLATKNPESAINWSAQLPSSIQPTTTRKIVEAVAGHSPKQVADWLAGMPAGRARNEGIRALIQELESADSEASNSWMSLIDASFD